jgi:hypothetical protein
MLFRFELVSRLIYTLLTANGTTPADGKHGHAKEYGPTGSEEEVGTRIY